MAIAAMVGVIVWIAWPGDAEPTAGDGASVNANGDSSVGDNSGLTLNSVAGPAAPANTGTHSRTNSSASVQAGLGSVLNGANQRTGNENAIVAPPLEPPLNLNSGTDRNSNTGHNSTTPAPVLIDPTDSQRPKLALNHEIDGLKQVLAAVRAYSTATTGEAGVSMQKGMALIADGKYIEGRRMLSKLLWLRGSALDHRDADTIRRTLDSVNKSLVFSDRTLNDDPHAEIYVVQNGEYLSSIAKRYHITYQLIEQINNVDARRIRVGQKLKVIKGPFHVVVTKSAYRMDIYLQEADGSMTYVRNFPVGVGKNDSTPIGTWICKPGGKLANPSWTHPHTNKHYPADDPKNPIGEHWIALRGTDSNTKGLSGYGIHGTVDPSSIGKQASLGCVRMHTDDVAMVYKLLVDGKSTVHIQP